MITLRYISQKYQFYEKIMHKKTHARFFLNFFCFFIILSRKNEQNTHFYKKHFLDQGMASFLITFLQNIELKPSVHKIAFMYAFNVILWRTPLNLGNALPNFPHPHPSSWVPCY